MAGHGLVAQLGAHHIRIVGVEGSNPFKSTKKEVTFVYQKLLLFYPSRRLGISSRFSVYIISPYGAVSHHASACISLRLDEIQHFVLVIYNASH